MKPDAGIRWLAAQPLRNRDTVAAASTEGRALSATGGGWFETLFRADGLSVFRAVRRRKPEAFEHLLQVGEFRIDFAESTLVAETVHEAHASGGLRHEPMPGGELIHKPGATFFRHTGNRQPISPLGEVAEGELTGIAITDSGLRGLLGERLTTQLLTGLGLDPAPIARVAAIPAHVCAPLRALAVSELEGKLMSVFAHAKALEYLCALAVHVTVNVGSPPRFARKRDIVRRLHEELAHLEGKLPTLGQLARQCGISPKTLNAEFAKAFGQSIHAYLSECRLRDAHAALQESAVPMKVLAERLGYSHVNNFISAFHKRFGYPPGSLRRGRRAEDV